MEWRTLIVRILFASAINLPASLIAAQNCPGTGVISATVVDPSNAPVNRAQVSLQNAAKSNATRTATAKTNRHGQVEFSCLPAGRYRLLADFPRFSPVLEEITIDGHHLQRTVIISLKLPPVVTSIDVAAGAGNPLPVDAGSNILNQQALAAFAEDPGDLERQLQALATAGGGAFGKATITVDGFQTASKLPPKSSLAEVRINPDMFSAEYNSPPYTGGRIEAYTRPGQSAFYGSLSTDYSSSTFNARDPLADASTRAGQQLFGLSLTGPLLPKKIADFSLDLDYRQISENATVNATLLSPAGLPYSFNQVIAAPQRLWLGNGRTTWQLAETDVLSVSFAANSNRLANAGVGGLVLPQAGYDMAATQYDFRIINTAAIRPSLLHATRLGITWKTTEEAPHSLAPSLQVAGAFTGGGSVDGHRLDREHDLEFDDDLSLSHGHHTAKLGVQVLAAFVNNRDPLGFNGAFNFGGSTLSAGASSATLSGLEQYRLALAGLPGGNPTTYSLTSGNPVVPLQQWNIALFAQDQWQTTPHLSLSTGLRYFAQTSPGIEGALAPRLGLAWAPGKRQSWVFHARAGLFYTPINTLTTAETIRLDGQRQQTITLYSPSFSDPLGTGTSSDIGLERRFASGFSLSPSFQSQFSVEHTFAHNWSLNANYYYTAHWGVLRSRNINAPDPSADTLHPVNAPRPFTPNLNIFQYEPSGRIAGSLAFLGLNHFGKRFNLIAGYLYNGLRGNTDGPNTFPQSSYSGRGDFSRLGLSPAHSLFAVLLLNLPGKVSVSTNLSAASGMPYDVTTGFDNNGDGVFNDRPSVASQIGTGVIPTPFGLLTAATVNGTLPRNAGTMPPTVHLDLNLGREWKLTKTYTLRLDVRSSNLLNHTNVIAVNSIFGGPAFTAPLKADYGRRLEIGARFSF